MGYIRKERLNTHFIVTDATTRVDDLVQALSCVPKSKRMSWNVIVRLPQNNFAVVSAEALQQAVDETNVQDIQMMSLKDVPDLLVASLTVERRAQGVGEARKVMRRSPDRRLVVLETGEPVGLLVEEELAGGFGGLPTSLFGKERKRYNVAKGRIIYRCPVCPESNNTYDFSEVVDLATKDRLICPNGHEIESEV